MEDRVEVALRQWAEVAPSVDVAPLAVTGRVLRLARLLTEAREAVLAPAGLMAGDFDVLAVLRRSAPPGGLHPRELLEAVMVTSGGMSKRLDRLEREGLLRRQADPDDRRAVRVRLTPEGRRLVDRLLPQVMDIEAALLGELGGAERDRLAGSLAKLLRAAEGAAR